MLWKALFPSAHEEKRVEVNLDPRPGVSAPPPSTIREWLDDDVEVIDLGETRRDSVIQPTTWHTG
jgi:hypothetical protein